MQGSTRWLTLYGGWTAWGLAVLLLFVWGATELGRMLHIGNVSLEAVAASAAAVVAAVTYLHASFRQRAISRAALVYQFSTDLARDADVVNLFVEIDNDRFRFPGNEEVWLGAQPEIVMVRMLDLFNSVGHSWSRNIVKLDDIYGTTLGYAILRASRDPGVREYLEHVARHDHAHAGTGVPFKYFRDLAKALDRMRPAATGDDPGGPAERELG